MNGEVPPQTPPPRAIPVQAVNRDLEHLRLLGIFHYVLAGITGLFSLMPLMHVVMGLLMVYADGFGPSPPPAFFGWIFVFMGTIAILLGVTLTILLILAAGFLRKTRRRMFCFVIAAVSCAYVPLGTILGIFTIIVLSRESVRRLFERQSQAAGGQADPRVST